jgi:hypothetical protein
MAHWPTAAALAKGDTKAIRWFASVALLERIALMRGNPILEAARRHLVELVSKEPLWESVLWAAFSLKDHEITSPIVSMPIYGLNPQLGPHQWISFAVRVGSPTDLLIELGKLRAAKPHIEQIIDERYAAPERDLEELTNGMFNAESQFILAVRLLPQRLYNLHFQYALDKLTFQVGESIRAYIQHRRAATESEQNVDFHRERAKKERAERRLREMLLEQTTGLVHASEDIRGVQSERYGMIRSRLIALPNALALRVTGQTREEIRGVRGCITFRDLYAPTHEIARNFVSTTLLCWPYGRKHRAIFRSIVASLKHWPAGRKVAF